MSGTHKELSRRGLAAAAGGGGSSCGGKSGSNNGEGGGGSTGTSGYEKTEQGGGKKSKRVSLFRFRKANKVQDRGKQRGGFVNSQCWGGYGGGGGGGGGGGCCLCMKRPTTVGSPGESPTSDSNSAEFSFEMLRGLIEKNNYYDKECNTHLEEEDVDSHLSSYSHIKEKL